ncbi:hypothetical protein, partial [Herbiconiux daphne]
MLTIEQKAAVARLQGQEKLISGLLEEVKADLIKAIVNTEPHELKTREENYQQYQLIKKLDNKIY